AALAVARRVARERGAHLVPVAGEAGPAPLRAKGSFQRLNFALARGVADAYLEAVAGDRSAPAPLRAAAVGRGGVGGASHRQAVAQAAACTQIPGRLQVLDQEPLTVLHGAHNPDAVAALVASLPEVLHGEPLGVVLGVLEDKDAAGMLRVLLRVCERAWFTAPPSPRALSPAALQSLARQLSFHAVACEPKPGRGLTPAPRPACRPGGA